MFSPAKKTVDKALALPTVNYHCFTFNKACLLSTAIRKPSTPLPLTLFRTSAYTFRSTVCAYRSNQYHGPG
jgi:hypothetical protein